MDKKELLEKVNKMSEAVNDLKEMQKIPNININYFISINYLEFELENIKKDLLK